DRGELVNGERLWTANHASKLSFTILRHRMSLCAQLAGTRCREAVTDELLRILERRIIRRDQHLRQHSHYIATVSRLAERVFERLLQHVANPSRGTRDEHA